VKRYEKLIDLRNECGFTQDKMAEIIETSKVTYHFKETGKSRFTIDECFLIVNALSENLKKDLTVDEVFK
jgi:DNA-binding XRE family transcriptional regulator